MTLSIYRNDIEIRSRALRSRAGLPRARDLGVGRLHRVLP